MKKYIFVIMLFGICSTTAYALCPVGVPGPAGVCGNLEFDSCSMNFNGVDRNYCRAYA